MALVGRVTNRLRCELCIRGRYMYTVEPLYNGHIGTDRFVHYREVVLFNVLPLYRLVC